MWPAISGRSLVADNADASLSIPTAPTAWVWANTRNANPDPQYDTATGVYTFAEDGFFTSVASWHAVGSTSRTFYADAEFSLDGGATWTRGTNSMREEQVTNASRTLTFPFAGWYARGTKLRYVCWASDAGVTVTTTANNGSTVPASRLTTSFIHGRKILWP